VGVDADMTADKDYCVFSTLKHIDKVIADYIGMWLKGSMPKHRRMGLADGMTDVVVGSYTYNTSLGQLNLDSLRQVAIRKEGERYAK
jgi:basic membrane protein A